MKFLKCATKIIFGGFESDNIYYTIYPFCKLCRLFGFYPVSIKLNSNEVRFGIDKLGCLYSAFIFILYTAGFLMAVLNLTVEISTNNVEYSIITYYTGWAQIVSLFILGVVGLLSSWIKINSTINIIKEMHKIDHDLEEIGVPISYRKFRNLFGLEMFLVLVIPTCFSMVNCFILKVRFENRIKLCFLCICFAPILLILLKEIQFCNFMLLIKSKFDLINSKLSQYQKMSSTHMNISEEKRTIVLNRSETKERLLFNDNICIIVEKLSEIYGRVNDAANNIMDTFSPHLLFISAISLGVLTIQCYNLYAFIVKSYVMTTYEIIATITWIVIHSSVIFINCTACSKSVEAMTTTGYLLHKVKWSQENQLSQIIQMFSLEVMHRNKNFTAAGFFILDNKLITSIFAAVTTYLVIIIQFHNENTESILNGTHKTACG